MCMQFSLTRNIGGARLSTCPPLIRHECEKIGKSLRCDASDRRFARSCLCMKRLTRSLPQLQWAYESRHDVYLIRCGCVFLRSVKFSWTNALALFVFRSLKLKTFTSMCAVVVYIFISTLYF